MSPPIWWNAAAKWEVMSHFGCIRQTQTQDGTGRSGQGWDRAGAGEIITSKNIYIFYQANILECVYSLKNIVEMRIMFFYG